VRTDLFDFALPDERIALRPVTPRDSARLLVVRPGNQAPFDDRYVSDLPELISPGDLIVFNNTRVIPARLRGLRWRAASEGVKIEVLLCRRISGDTWAAFARPAKRLTIGDRIEFGDRSLSNACLLGSLWADVVGRGDAGEVTLRFAFHGPVLDEAIERIGEIPLPPYIAGKRPADTNDSSDYQTVFAQHDGSIAAPTAGLHFTPELLRRLDECGVQKAFVTLHVGPGTFLPVKTETVEAHRMHAEWGEVTADVCAAITQCHASNRKVIAVGTTALRLLESAATPEGELKPFRGETDIFITPGYGFRVVDALMTNFHLPRSTLFMLVCAFSGVETMKRAYAHAIATGYRFYSYGDSSLLFRPGRDA
jgi:S-adenosylmethionine:tRNA ribosyltransferase-isomerase